MERSQGTRTIIVALLASLVMLAMPARALADDAGLQLNAGVSHKFTKKLGINAGVEFRSRNNFRTADRVGLEAGVSYKPLRWLKADAGYTLLISNFHEKTTLNTDGSYNNWRPSDWGLRHRVHVSLTGSVTIDRVTLSLRERWQYTYRPERTTERFDFDEGEWETTTVRSKHKHVLRSRLKGEYNIPHCKLTPFLSAELYNNLSFVKARFETGASYKIHKVHTLEAFYRYQAVHDDVNNHIIGLGYNYKF